ncbi:MAG TPA: amidohydrolase family protein [Steroidobacteraceae bacterium]|nr:amidohydrolase family protein [Steroidobacteraceae bacterium]
MKTRRMVGYCVASLAMGIASQLATAAGAPGTAVPIALKAAHLFDSISGNLIDHGVVVISGNKIQSVGADLKIPADAKVIDLGDATLLPGFIDAHVHLDSEMTSNYYLDAYEGIMRFPAEQALHGARNAKVTLEAGVTTVRDLGSTDYISLGLRNAIRDGLIPGPRMLIANYAIGSTGGHADQDPYPPQRIAVAGPIQGVCNGPDECREAVRYQIKYGADVIKFMPSGGVLSLSDPVDNAQLTQEEMNAIVTEAHNWGRKVAAHCHGDKAAKMAIAAGVDSIEHGSFLKDDTLLEMKRRHVYLVATLFAGFWANGHADTFPAPIAAKAHAAAAQAQLMFQHAVKLGVPLAMGTDAGVEPHGLNAREFSLMTENGLSAAQALIAGTANSAELLGLSDLTGTLAVGKLADIIAVAGNPLTDMQTTEHALFVMKEGSIYVSPTR